MPSPAPIKRRRGRPPKGSSDPNATRQALLRAGVEVLTEKGFSAAGIDEILRRVDVPKGSFYHYFSNKEAFGSALIEEYDRYFSAKLKRILGNTSLPPLQRIKSFVEDAASGMARHQFQRGCLAGNLGQEMTTLPQAFRAQLLDVFEHWQALLETCLQQAQQAGVIQRQTDCSSLSRLFWIGCGRADRLMGGNERFVAWLKEKSVRHVFCETEGGHEWSLWRRYLTELLPQLFRDAPR